MFSTNDVVYELSYLVFILLFPLFLRHWAHKNKKPLSIPFAYISFFAMVVMCQAALFVTYWVCSTFVESMPSILIISMLAIILATTCSFALIQLRPRR